MTLVEFAWDNPLVTVIVLAALIWGVLRLLQQLEAAGAGLVQPVRRGPPERRGIGHHRRIARETSLGEADGQRKARMREGKNSGKIYATIDPAMAGAAGAKL